MNLVGKVLADRYEIREEIGKGGMAHVYKAWCNLLNRYVAIKVLKEEFRDDKEFVHRFNVEAQAAAGISNLHVVSIYDVGYQDGFYYIVMEYIEGVILKEYISRKGVLPWREAASIAAQICEGLAAAHKANVVHRDIKPQNIIMTPEGILKVTDFGIARASSQATTTTTGGQAIGTVHYISPEQARGGYTDQRTDIYSLGVVLYEMLTGKMPFVGESPVAVAIKHIQNKPTPVRMINPEIPEAIEAIVLKAMEKEQSARYATAEEFLRDLNRAMKNPTAVRKTINEEDEMGSTIKMDSINAKTIETFAKERPVKKVPERVEPVERKRLSAREVQQMREMEAKKQEEQKKKDRLITWVAFLAALLVIGLLWLAFSTWTNGMKTAAEKVTIPNLVGMELEKAREKYSDFSIILSEEKKSDKKAGTILSQTPEANKTEQKKDDMEIHVVVSAGKNATVLSSYVDMDKDSAQAKVLKDGFQVNVEERTSNSAEKGIVFAQEPIPGSSVSEGALITLYVSKGPDEEEEPEETEKPVETEKPTPTEEPEEPVESAKPTQAPVESTKPAPEPVPTVPSGGVTAPGIGD